MSRILITGGAGFVGAAVVHKLLTQKQEVAVIVRPTTDLRRIRDVLDDVTVIYGDLFHIEESRKEIECFSPECVAHLGWSGVSGAGRNGTQQLDNLTSSIDLYRLTEETGCNYFLGLGSQAEYGVQTGKINEDSPTRPTTVYGAAKLATALVLERISATSQRPFAWLRLFSSYGPDDDPNYLIPYLTTSLLSGKYPKLTPAEQIWDYIHVDDVAGAIVAALDARVCGMYNLGSGTARPLRAIVRMIHDLINPTLPLGFGQVPYRADQVMHLEADISALTKAIDWKPQVALENGLNRVVEWYRENSKANRDSA